MSVVIPTYNGSPHLAETVASVRAQTYRSWELVVYDDGSSDDTVAVARTAAGDDPRILVVEGRNGGVAAARNAGFALTDPRSPYVGFLDHDDIWEPAMLETLVAELEAHPELAAAHAIATCIDEHGHRPADDDIDEYMRNRSGFRDGRLAPVGRDAPTTFADLAHQNWILTPGTLLMRREVATAIGGFDGDVTPADDWDIAVRVSRQGDIGFVDRPLLRWRRHVGAQSYASPGYGRAHMPRPSQDVDRPHQLAGPGPGGPARVRGDDQGHDQRLWRGRPRARGRAGGAPGRQGDVASGVVRACRDRARRPSGLAPPRSGLTASPVS